VPELPEVAAAALELTKAALGKTIAAVRPVHFAMKKKFPPADARRVKGRRIEGVERQGKHQLLRLDSGDTLVVHFRMNGDWEIGTTGEEIDRFARGVIELTDGTRISLIDSRALSSIMLDREGSSSLPKLGMDANDPGLDAAHLKNVLARKKIGIKPALMDQAVLAGLGNIYAAEALWRAGIDPTRPASSVSPAKLARIADSIRYVLSPEAAIPGRYTDGDTEGRFAVYGREGEKCRKCGTKVSRIVQAGRSTYFCKKCQRG